MKKPVPVASASALIDERIKELGDGDVRRAIDIHEGEKIDEAALKNLIRAAVALNLEGKRKPKPRAR